MIACTERVEHVKACTCNSRATAGGLRHATVFNEKTQSYQVRITLSPEPVCDACGTPWKRVK